MELLFDPLEGRPLLHLGLRSIEPCLLVSRSFQDLVAAVSLRENRRLYETGNRAKPHWDQPTDLFVTFSDADFRLGFNAAQTTLGAVVRLVDARIVGGR